MDYDFSSAMEYIHAAEKLGSIMGLETERRLLMKLSEPQNKIKIIHIAGTNGKGSTLAMISTILTEAGFRVGRYISPTLTAYLERFQIDGNYISEEAFARVMGRIIPAAEQIKAEGAAAPTAFELETAAAFLYFYEEKCDFAVIETGMGGTYDATNVCRAPVCCVLASIGMDHMNVLGSTLSEIAENKAGIIKFNSPAVTTLQKPEVMEVIKKRCEKTQSPLVLSDFTKKAGQAEYGNIFSQAFTAYMHEDLGKIELSLCGTFQIENSCLAISCIEVLRNLGYNISDETIKKGLRRTEWFGRLTRIGQTPPFFADGAHNVPAARALAASVKEYFCAGRLAGRSLVYIMGIFSDKDYDGIIKLMLPMSEHVFTVATPDNPRAMSSRQLADIINTYKECATACVSISEAVERACRYNDGNTAVLAFGSLSHLTTIREAYMQWIRRK